MRYFQAFDEWAYDAGHWAIQNHHHELLACFESFA